MSNKVLFVHDGYLYKNGRLQYFGVHYSNKIVDRYLNLGDQVTFATRIRAMDMHKASKYSLIDHPAFNHIEVPDFKSINKYFTVRPRAKKIIENAVEKHDALVARMPSASGTMGIKFARQLNKPYLVEYVGCTFDSYWNYNWKGKLIAHYKMHEQKRIIKECPYVIYVTKEFLQERYPTKGKSINCSNVEIGEIESDSLDKRLQKINSSGIDVLTLGTVAAINVPYKGQADVIKAIAVLKEQGMTFNYKLVGQGNPERIKKLVLRLGVKDQVEILGPLDHSKVFRFLENIDLYIQPSKTEGLPRALIEAMSKACPAIGSEVGGIPELLQDKAMFKPGSIKEIVVKLKNINSNWLAAQSKRNFRVSKEYLKENLKKRRLNFYDEFLNDNGVIKE